eukprot:2230283-Amphidinium_carterae.1
MAHAELLETLRTIGADCTTNLNCWRGTLPVLVPFYRCDILVLTYADGKCGNSIATISANVTDITYDQPASSSQSLVPK